MTNTSIHAALNPIQIFQNPDLNFFEVFFDFSVERANLQNPPIIF